MPPISAKFFNFPLFSFNLTFFAQFRFFGFPPVLTMMHLCIMLYTYWTPLSDYIMRVAVLPSSTPCPSASLGLDLEMFVVEVFLACVSISGLVTTDSMFRGFKCWTMYQWLLPPMKDLHCWRARLSASL